MGVPVRFLLDSGSTITTINEHMHLTMSDLSHAKFQGQILGYSQTPLNVLGQFTADITHESSSRPRNELIAVVKGNAVNLLSYKACVALGLITINIKASTFSIQSSTVENHTTPGWRTTVDELTLQYPNLFKQAIGRIPEVKMKLFIDESIPPVVQKPRHMSLYK